jgi:RimJ/RimL family protein N-acetyltransferase
MIVVELRSGAVLQLTVDYFDRSYHRGCRIVGERATAHWSWERERVRVRGGTPGAETSDERVVPADVAPAYRRQMESFLAAADGRGDDRAGPRVRPEGVVGAREARDTLAVVDAVAASSSQGRRVAVAPRIELRAAAESDSGRLLAWRNDPDTRRWSRSQDEVSAQEHRDWLERVQSDPGTQQWIAEADGVPVGQIRLTREPTDAAELHVTVAPEARGRRLGAELIIEAAARGLAETTVHRLIAHVKSDNEPSCRAFARAGFELRGRDGAGLLRLERERCG